MRYIFSASSWVTTLEAHQYHKIYISYLGVRWDNRFTVFLIPLVEFTKVHAKKLDATSSPPMAANVPTRLIVNADCDKAWVNFPNHTRIRVFP